MFHVKKVYSAVFMQCKQADKEINLSILIGYNRNKYNSIAVINII